MIGIASSLPRLTLRSPKPAFEVKHAPIRSPNTVAFVERFVQTIQQECLDHFIVFGESHMDHLCREFVEHYHYRAVASGARRTNCCASPRENRRRTQAEALSLARRPLPVSGWADC